jgi:hypothetical protein
VSSRVCVGELGPDSESGIADQHIDRLLEARQSLGNPCHISAYG